MRSRLNPRFDAFVRPARLRPQLWRLLLGGLFSILVYVGWVSGVITGLWWLTGTGDIRSWATPILTGRTPTGALILLFTFLGMALGPMLAARLLHKRPAHSLFGRGAVVIRDFVLAASVVGLLYLITSIIWAWRFDAVPNVTPALWLKLLPVALIGLLIQTGAEELLFRGYLQQQLAARFRSPLIWMFLPALLFGAAHYDPQTAGGNVWLMMAAAALFGLLAADLTAQTGSIGAAWGFHFANNFAALMILSLQGTLSGLALFTTPYGPDDISVLPALVLVDLAILALTWGLVRRLVRR